MKSTKIAGFYKLVAFALIAVILVIAAQVAVSGWQSPDTNMPDSGEAGNNTNQTDENKDGENDTTTAGGNSSSPSGGEEVIPKYYNYLTGLETTDEASRAKPICFVLNSSSPLYALSYAQMLIEIPIEEGSTRLVAYMSEREVLGKIGSLATSRPYISRAAEFFGGIVVFSGSEYKNSDFFPAWEAGESSFDLSKFTGYCYTENTLFLYTNNDLIAAGMANTNMNTTLSETPTLPFDFTSENTKIEAGDKKATTVILPYSASNETELFYSAERGSYTYCKSGSAKTDLLNAKNAEFINVFILFADSKLHYTENGKSFEMNTAGGGRGYYATGGGYTEITWSVDEGGNLIFWDEGGAKLTVNRGRTYIGYFISSDYASVEFIG